MVRGAEEDEVVREVEEALEAEEVGAVDEVSKEERMGGAHGQGATWTIRTTSSWLRAKWLPCSVLRFTIWMGQCASYERCSSGYNSYDVEILGFTGVRGYQNQGNAMT